MKKFAIRRRAKRNQTPLYYIIIDETEYHINFQSLGKLQLITELLTGYKATNQGIFSVGTVLFTKGPIEIEVVFEPMLKTLPEDATALGIRNTLCARMKQLQEATDNQAYVIDEYASSDESEETEQVEECPFKRLEHLTEGWRCNFTLLGITELNPSFHPINSEEIPISDINFKMGLYGHDLEQHCYAYGEQNPNALFAHVAYMGEDYFVVFTQHQILGIQMHESAIEYFILSNPVTTSAEAAGVRQDIKKCALMALKGFDPFKSYKMKKEVPVYHIVTRVGEKIEAVPMYRMG